MATEDVFTAQRAKPFYLVIIRMITMIALAITTCFTLGLTGISGNFPPLDMLYFPFVNIICAVVILRTFRQRRTSVWRYLGFEKTRLGKDIAWGFLWLIVTYIPLFVVLMGSMYLMFGSDMFQHFEQVFAKSSPQLPAGVLAVMSVLGAVVFLVNAPWLAPRRLGRTSWHHGRHRGSGTCLRPAAHHVRRRWAWHDHPRLRVLCVGCHSRRHRSQAAAIGADGDRPLDRQHCSWGGANAGARIHGCVGGTTL